MEDTVIGVTVVAVLLISVAFYVLPSIIAIARKVPHSGSAVVINIFLGWTFFGWVIALAMALRSRPPRAVGVPPAWNPDTPGVPTQQLPGTQPAAREVRQGPSRSSPPEQETAE